MHMCVCVCEVQALCTFKTCLTRGIETCDDRLIYFISFFLSLDRKGDSISVCENLFVEFGACD